jgi:hypothetical protein
MSDDSETLDAIRNAVVKASTGSDPSPVDRG